MRLIAVVVVLAVLGFGLYVRLAPQDAERWHVPITETTDADYKSGAVRVIEAGPDALQRADDYMRNLPRTQVVAGSVEEGRITYVTRSQLWAFPDYTTIEQAGEQLRAYARLRFGKSDMGVNRARLEGLVAALQG